MTQNTHSHLNHTSESTRIPFDTEQAEAHQPQSDSVAATLFDIIKHSDFPEPATGDAKARNPRRYRDHARRLVDTRAMDRNTWLAIRRSGLGSSDAAAALGLNPYTSQLELWMEKTGRQSGTAEPLGADQLTSPLHWGQVLEPLVAEHYARHTGHRVQRVNAILQHVDHPWMMANLDWEIISNDEVQILECKTAGIHGARLWKDGVPEYVQLQVMHQLAVTGQKAADVAVLLGGHELQIHRIERDEAMIEQLVALERQFWDHVENDTPPPADGSDSADTALRALFARDNGDVVDFSEDATLSQVFADLQITRKVLDNAKKDEVRLRHRLQQAMGHATQANFPSGRITWKQSQPSTRLDGKALQQDHPELCARYLTSVAGSRRFLMRS